MERRLPLAAVFTFLFFASSLAFCQNLNQNEKIQFILWAEKEAYPGVDWNSGKVPLWGTADNVSGTEDNSGGTEAADSEENPFALPVSRLKKTAPFFVQGMLYGWQVEYTPGDKARGVEEYLEFTEIRQMTEGELKLIQYKNPAFKDDRLYCRVEFVRSEANLNLYKGWQTVNNPRVRGTGYASLEKGFEGIQEACGEAMKNAVREYWRKRIKNKPREISGRLLLCQPPVIGVDSGRYRVMLDFFMETDRILEYKMF